MINLPEAISGKQAEPSPIAEGLDKRIAKRQWPEAIPPGIQDPATNTYKTRAERPPSRWGLTSDPNIRKLR